MLLKIKTPLNSDLPNLAVGDKVEISGIIYTARDAIMPKITKMIKDNSIKKLSISLKGSAVMHTACSPSGFGPTSSNKEEIEEAMEILSKAGVKLHIGKGAIKQQTVDKISKYGSVFIIIPPTSALFQNKLISKKIIAFKEEGIEALHELKVESIPGIVAAANGKTIFK